MLFLPAMADSGLTRSQKAIVFAHVLLALLFSFLVPPFEAQDEPAHVRVIQILVTEARFPRANSQTENLFDQSHQPPLYYLLAAAWSFGLNWRSLSYPQPNVFGFDASNRAGYRLFLPTTADSFPWRETNLIVHLLRLTSVALSTLTVLLIAKCLRRVLGSHSHAISIATAFVAFNPQFIFVGAIVNNDVLVNLFGAGLILLLTRAWALFQINWRAALCLGLVLGLSLWAKRSAVSFMGVVFLGCAWLCWRIKLNRAQVARVFAALVCGFVIMAAPLLTWNKLHHGTWLPDRDPADKLLAQPTANLASGLELAWRDHWLVEIFTNAFKTFWGAFGWSNVRLPEAVYDVLAILCGALFIGYLIVILSRSTHLFSLFAAQQRSLWRMLGAVILFPIAVPTYRALYFHDSHLLPGRYLFVSLAAIAACLGVGWVCVLQGVPVIRRSLRVQALLTLGVLSANALLPIASLFAVIVPAFAPNFVATTPGLTLGRFDESVEVAQLSARTIYKPDPEGTRQYTRVQVTWRALRREDTNLAFGIAVLGKDNEVLGQQNIFPAKGNYPGTLWQPGTTFQDEYDILMDKPCAQLPAMGKIYLSVFRLANKPIAGVQQLSQLHMRDAAGRVVSPILGRFRVDALPRPYPIFWLEPSARFDRVIGLRDTQIPATVRAGETFTAAITYEMLGTTLKQGVVFVHVLNADGKLVAQDDHEPNRVTYPTDFWLPGECARESFAITIPASVSGALNVVTGIYDKTDQQRFQVTTELASTRIITPSNVVDLGMIEIKP